VLSFPVASILDSCFPHAMKMCTIQDSPKADFFFFNSGFLLLKILLRDYLCARIVKLTNSLVEHSPKNSGFLSRMQHQKETSNYTSELIVT
jgi:hypothetical protein